MGEAQETSLLPLPLVLRKRLFCAGTAEAGRGLRGLCFSLFYSVFIEKEFVTVHNHEIN